MNKEKSDKGGGRWWNGTQTPFPKNKFFFRNNEKNYDKGMRGVIL
jgi:hypothetical protein